MVGYAFWKALTSASLDSNGLNNTSSSFPPHSTAFCRKHHQIEHSSDPHVRDSGLRCFTIRLQSTWLDLGTSGCLRSWSRNTMTRGRLYYPWKVTIRESLYFRPCEFLGAQSVLKTAEFRRLRPGVNVWDFHNLLSRRRNRCCLEVDHRFLLGFSSRNDVHRDRPWDPIWPPHCQSSGWKVRGNQDRYRGLGISFT